MFFLAAWCTSCKKQETQRAPTKQEIKQKVDSILTVKTLEVETAGKTDLKHRLRIEVKVKADSIVNAHLAAKAHPKDSVKEKLNK